MGAAKQTASCSLCLDTGYLSVDAFGASTFVRCECERGSGGRSGLPRWNRRCREEIEIRPFPIHAFRPKASVRETIAWWSDRLNEAETFWRSHGLTLNTDIYW